MDKVTILDLKKVFQDFYATRGDSNFAELMKDDDKLLACDLRHDLSLDSMGEVVLSLECERVLGIHIDMATAAKFLDENVPLTVERLLAICNNEL
ncbi:MAG: hypothetical protein IJ564_04455 [Alphaproteobacteria bacterium]|nr:hypothetical protein [Alphaproteobacteria bacterium]MBR3662954.1 hypothetical protein [Alphaproteobacteria bacterium]